MIDKPQIMRRDGRPCLAPSMVPELHTGRSFAAQRFPGGMHPEYLRPQSRASRQIYQTKGHVQVVDQSGTERTRDHLGAAMRAMACQTARSRKASTAYT